MRNCIPLLLLAASAATPSLAQTARPNPRQLPLIYWSPERTEKALLEKGIHSTYAKSAFIARERHGGKATDFINEFGEEGGAALAVLSRKGGKQLLDLSHELQDVSRSHDLLSLIALHPQRERIVELMWKFRASFSKTHLPEALLADTSAVLRLGRKATLEQIEKVHEDAQKNILELLLDP